MRSVDSAEVDRLLTAAEVGARWQVPASAVYRMTRQGRLPTVRIGRYYRYSIEAIRAFERDGGDQT
jgi:excisionase family DNA binding protein